jgi:diguanylate cyclase (GGDEF)-like protein/PAS domain S-box-containing protein
MVFGNGHLQVIENATPILGWKGATMPHNRLLRRLFEISTRAREGLGVQVAGMLDVGIEHFGLEIGLLARIDAGGLVIEHAQGPVSERLAPGCRLQLPPREARGLLRPGHLVGIADADNAEPLCNTLMHQWDLSSLIGVTVESDGEPYGVLAFASSRVHTGPISAEELDVLESMAQWLGSELWRRNQEEHLRRAEERFRKGVEASPAGILMVEGDGIITYANAQAAVMFGFGDDDLTGQNIETLVPMHARARHADARRRFTRDHGSRGIGMGSSVEAVRRDGTVFSAEVGLTPIDTAEGTRVLCTVLDLTERLRFEQKIIDQAERLRRINQTLAEQAISDSLTGLSNRRGLEAQMEAIMRLARRRRQPTSLLMLDVDHFKDYNDTFGHPAGDEALREVARVLQETARRSDIVARFGGEEFVVLLPETGWEGAQDVAERIRESVAALDTLQRQVTVSVGIATRGGLEGGASVVGGMRAMGDGLIREADEALYAAKQAGRNRVVGFGVG